MPMSCLDDYSLCHSVNNSSVIHQHRGVSIKHTGLTSCSVLDTSIYITAMSLNVLACTNVQALTASQQ